MQAITTLGQLIEGGYAITAHCGDCRHSKALDLSALAERLGPGFVAIGTPNPLMERLRCEKCGKKRIGLIIGAPDVPTPGGSIYGRQ
jgi:hypothetical protein